MTKDHVDNFTLVVGTAFQFSITNTTSKPLEIGFKYRIEKYRKKTEKRWK